MNNSKVIDNDNIINKIVEGMQEKKAKDIVVVNMSKLKEAPCSYFVICSGDSNTHVNAIAHSIKDYVKEHIQLSPEAAIGFENGEWVAMDYAQIIVHVFQPAIRSFYDIEHLWEDAERLQINDIN